jgi:hypothetical protein
VDAAVKEVTMKDKGVTPQPEQTIWNPGDLAPPPAKRL